MEAFVVAFPAKQQDLNDGNTLLHGGLKPLTGARKTLAPRSNRCLPIVAATKGFGAKSPSKATTKTSHQASSCPCGSGQKYTECCKLLHDTAPIISLSKLELDDKDLQDPSQMSPSALELLKSVTAERIMKARYSAYVVGQADFIIFTTHPKNPDYENNRKKWKRELQKYTRDVKYEKLEILEFAAGEEESFVHFRALGNFGPLEEHSRFIRNHGFWVYESGKLIQEGQNITSATRFKS